MRIEQSDDTRTDFTHSNAMFMELYKRVPQDAEMKRDAAVRANASPYTEHLTR